MNKINLHHIPSQPFIHSQIPKRVEETSKHSFSEHLIVATNNIAGLKISKHASERLEERNIMISNSEWERVSTKVNKAKAKGIKESLVLLDQAALIVSVKNATVITAMDRSEAKDQLFTNIDGTIVLS
ncbi:TIGR02530 family flagellar biosynthesis protein [Sporosarcina pasteurii]|uniref:Flagellar operon protein n=1 Tax=Sporosarcina pasteurii TaxID=1474 RepID=A0A380BGY6_SPOPA|nr:TIGR02530 family flagellar biosynthesis protein [Sporosarcina pasteurii]MDS9470586.1 TIGR02530 family flagellar biosynthesis protein [Sporosarcina pasteurii]QBQ05725.1 flagellar protein [Sporosarcina pasteurii]SUJ00815.1 flagellar operon protein [Sporosarcina pasteurii]